MELLFFKYDHSKATPTPTVEQLAALHKPMDLIEAKPDGWNWGTQERTHPWFRLVYLPNSLGTLSEAIQYLSPLLPTYDSNGLQLTLWQRRSHYLNVLDSTVIPQSFITFWEDDTRAVPMFDASTTFAGTTTQLTVARPAISNPNYTGTPSTPLTITS